MFLKGNLTDADISRAIGEAQAREQAAQRDLAAAQRDLDTLREMQKRRFNEMIDAAMRHRSAAFGA